MNTRERINAVLNFKPVDRLPMIEWAAWWDKTIERWQSEGLPVSGGLEVMKYFGLDIHYQFWISPRGSGFPPPPAHGKGVVSSIDDYMRMKKFLYPFPAFDEDLMKIRSKEQERGDAALWFSLEGFFWFPRVLLGIENHLYSFYDDPELMHIINRDLSEYHEKVLDRIFTICTPDFMTFAEDMSYNNGPMLSQAQFDEFIKPYYLKLAARLRERGTKIIVDSDGDIEKLCNWYDGVVDGFLPLERQAGTDIGKLRAEHPGQIYIGAFDKTVMHLGEEALRREFERLLPVARKGGFIMSCDHQTPPGVSLNDYRLYLKLFREYAQYS